MKYIFNYKNGGKFLGIEGAMLVEDAVEMRTRSMIRVRCLDLRSRAYGQTFLAYHGELSPITTCIMSES